MLNTTVHSKVVSQASGGRDSQICVFKDSLVYRVSSRIAKAVKQRHPVSVNLHFLKKGTKYISKPEI